MLDFSKAFDTVPHQKLLYKLKHYGIKGPLHKWLANFLTQRQMRVVIDGQLSREASVDSGVPQGTLLGPLFFLCHINDLPSAVRSQVRLFADDCLLYREIHSHQDHTWPSCTEQDLPCSSWRYGRRLGMCGGWSSTPRNATSWVYAASHPTYTPWKTRSWNESH